MFDHFNPDFKNVSIADLKAMIDWLDADRCRYRDMTGDARNRMMKELDARILCFVKNSDSMKEEPEEKSG